MQVGPVTTTEDEQSVPLIIQIEGATITFNAAEVHLAGGYAIIMAGTQKVGEVAVERVADKPDGTPQYASSIVYEFDPNEWNGDPNDVPTLKA
jgi:hypothetical protein